MGLTSRLVLFVLLPQLLGLAVPALDLALPDFHQVRAQPGTALHANEYPVEESLFGFGEFLLWHMNHSLYYLSATGI
jgi:hypothetical protein